MRKAEYLELLKSPRWQKRRLEILERDEWACQLCGDEDSQLHVHHWVYEWNRPPWEYPDEAMVTLCESCHERETKNGKTAEKRLIRALRQFCVTYQNINALSTNLEREFNLRGVRSGKWAIVYALGLAAQAPIGKVLDEIREHVDLGMPASITTTFPLSTKDGSEVVVEMNVEVRLT